MKIKEQLTSYSQALSGEFGRLGVMGKGAEGAQAVNDAIKTTATEEKNEKQMIIRKPIKSGLATKLIGKSKMDKPIGKLYSIGKSENKEATGSGGAGGYVAPLFGEPKETKEKLKKVETKEATGAGSAGAYSTTAAWAPTMKKKDWIGKSKTQYPGGKFVQVKKKCTKFPYCNQGDIKALKLTENETVKKIITKISKEHNISENVIKTILSYEYENNKKKK